MNFDEDWQILHQIDVLRIPVRHPDEEVILR